MKEHHARPRTRRHGLKKDQAELGNILTKNRYDSLDDAASREAGMELNYSQELSGTDSVQFQLHATEERQSMQFGQTFSPDSAPILTKATEAGDVLGFAVVKKTPWHFGGIYAQEDEAQRVAANLGSGYEVQYGLHRFDSDDSYY